MFGAGVVACAAAPGVDVVISGERALARGVDSGVAKRAAGPSSGFWKTGGCCGKEREGSELMVRIVNVMAVFSFSVMIDCQAVIGQ